MKKKTLGTSKAIINFDDGSIVRLDEFSRIILDGEKGKTIIVQTDGNSYHRVAKNEKRTYEVELSGIEGMPNTKIESLGTAFWVEKIGTELSVGVLESKVKYSEEGGSSLDVEEGQKLTIKEKVQNKEEIATEDLTKSFIRWNIDQDDKKEMSVAPFVRLKIAGEEKKEDQQQNQEQNQQKEEQKQEGAVNLTGEATDQGVVLKWTLNGVEAPDGLKIVKGPNQNPEYPGSYYRSVRSGTTTSYTWDVADGNVHHFRICVYDGSSGCKNYSNDLEVKANKVSSEQQQASCTDSGGTWSSDKCNCPTDEELKDNKCVTKTDDSAKQASCTDSGGTWSTSSSKCTCPDAETLDKDRCVKKDYATSVTLTGSNKNKKEASLSWTISGGKATDGYKVIKSKKTDPTYTSANSVSISKEATKSYKWEDLTKGEIYYFRVCVWDGSKCVTYSNSDKVEIKQ